MIAGAGSIFLVNIVLKATLSDFQYGEYSIFITFIQVCISFGFLGLEQVFLRLSEVSNKQEILRLILTRIMILILIRISNINTDVMQKRIY